MTACLIHFNLDTSLLMRYLGNNYTGAYREVDKIAALLKVYKIDNDLIDKYIRVMLSLQQRSPQPPTGLEEDPAYAF